MLKCQQLLAFNIYEHYKLHAQLILFIWFDSLRPSQQFFSYAGTGLPGLNQYYARINVSFSRTQGSDAGEARNPQPFSLESSTLPLSYGAPYAQLSWACKKFYNLGAWSSWLKMIMPLTSTSHINPCLVLVQPSKTRPDITEKLLTDIIKSKWHPLLS